LPGAAVADLKQLLHKAGLRGKHKETYWKYLMHAPDILSKSFQPMYTKSAFKTSGVCPFNAKKILSVNPYFRTLCTEDAQWVIDCIPELAKRFEEKD
ncbi:hypothetical protein B484DRAFT_410671, partial [Ochromonadaceae sp. CCMP2298]